MLLICNLYLLEYCYDTHAIYIPFVRWIVPTLTAIPKQIINRWSTWPFLTFQCSSLHYVCTIPNFLNSPWLRLSSLDFCTFTWYIYNLFTFWLECGLYSQTQAKHDELHKVYLETQEKLKQVNTRVNRQDKTKFDKLMPLHFCQ